MSIINNIGTSDPTGRITSNPVYKNNPADPTATAPASVGDRLELSGASQHLQTLQSNNIRLDKVSAAREQIAAGTYETDGKLDVTVEKLLDELTK